MELITFYVVLSTAEEIQLVKDQSEASDVIVSVIDSDEDFGLVITATNLESAQAEIEASAEIKHIEELDDGMYSFE